MSKTVPIKLVMVGDKDVGKTYILLSYTQNRFPTDYVPTIFDNLTTRMKVDENIVNLEIWDTAGHEDYARFRTLAYQDTDIFLITFLVTEKSTFVNAIKKWYKEVHKAVPKALITFVGNKIDLRLTQQGIDGSLSESEIRKQLSGIDCLYHECNGLTIDGLKQIFQNSVREALRRKNNTSTFTQPVEIFCNCQLI